MYDVLPKAEAAGVRLLLGDDYGAIGFAHGTYGGELKLYVEEAGFAPADFSAGQPATARRRCGAPTTSARSSRASWPTSW